MFEDSTVRRFTRQATALANSDALDAEALAQLVAIRDAYDAALTSAVGNMRALGYSWTDIGRGLNMTRANAHRKYRYWHS